MAASIITLLPLVSVPVVKLNALRATACCAFCGCLNCCLRRLACVVLPRKRGKALHAHRPKRRGKRKRKGREGPGCVRTCDVPVGCTCMCREGRRGHLVSLLSVCGGGERMRERQHTSTGKRTPNGLRYNLSILVAKPQGGRICTASHKATPGGRRYDAGRSTSSATHLSK